MTEEQIIQNEARIFTNRYMRLDQKGVIPIVLFRQVKTRLKDFYSPNAKAIFLDTVRKLIMKKFNAFKNQMQALNAVETKEDVFYAERVNTLLFYLKQEVETLPILAQQKYNGTSKHKRNKVFICYSPADMGDVAKIKLHFKPLEKQIDFWDASQILPGQKWEEVIQQAIAQTKVAILLISAEFLASDFIIDHTLPALLSAAEKEGAVILSVLLSPCLLDMFPEIMQFQSMNPSHQSLSQLNENDKAALYVNLVRQTYRILQL